MKTKIVSIIIYLGFSFCLMSCSLSKTTDKTYIIAEEQSHILLDTTILPLKCTLFSIRISSTEKLSFPYKNHSSTLELTKDGVYSGTAICNRFGGIYHIKNNSIKFGTSGMTRVNCGDSGIEYLITNTLSEINNFLIDDGILFLKKDNNILMIYLINKNNL